MTEQNIEGDIQVPPSFQKGTRFPDLQVTRYMREYNHEHLTI